MIIGLLNYSQLGLGDKADRTGECAQLRTNPTRSHCPCSGDKPAAVVLADEPTSALDDRN